MARLPLLLLVAGLLAASVQAQGVRSHTRTGARGTRVSDAQASDLTLTLTQVAVRQLQVWVRTAGSLDAARKLVTAHVTGPDAALIKVGQRARAFPVESRSSMFQAFVVRVAPEKNGTTATLQLQSEGWPTTKGYIVEIVTDQGELLSVPNEALIEEGDARVVYRQGADGQYEPTPIKTGIQGELYTQVVGGVKEGDQVVTFGSFFIDSEYKLKGTAQSGR
jgi:hypothetical protein